MVGAEADALLGRRFGSYVVEQKLGEGGMGAVYRAVQPEIGKQVAIKFLAPQLSAHPEVVQRFFAEAKAVNLIQHDNIVDIFDFGQTDGLSYFVMELLRGESLEATLVERQRLSLGRTVDIAIQVADAISAAHARNIIHRDLKPDNIYLVTRSGRRDFVKLLDFGIAKLAGSDGNNLSRTMAGVVLGTPGYMSPEQGTGGAVDARTDIYALGVILFRMLSGQLPFDGPTFAAILQRQLTEPPPNLRALRSDVSPSLAQLVHKMFAREPGDRPEQMREVLERLIAEQPAVGREASGSFRPLAVAPSGELIVEERTTLSGAAGEKGAFGEPPATRRAPTLLVAGGAALAIVVAGVAWVGSGKRPAGAAPPTAPAAHEAVAPAPAPATATAPTVANPAPATTAPVAASFQIYVESDPPGAEVFAGSDRLGVTPGKLTVPGDEATLRLHLGGFHDERIEVTRHTEHTVVRLHVTSRPAHATAHTSQPSSGATRLPSLPPPAVASPAVRPASAPHAPAPAAPGKPRKPAIGLDD